VLQAVKGFEEAFTGIYQMYEDQAFLAKIYLSTPVYASAESWTLYRLHEKSSCYRVQSSGKELQVRGFYLNWLAEYLDDHDVPDVRTLRALRRAQLLVRHPWICNLAIAPGKMKEAIKSLIRPS